MFFMDWDWEMDYRGATVSGKASSAMLKSSQALQRGDCMHTAHGT
jgi:hypothetical protein